MKTTELIFLAVTELFPLIAALIAFILGLRFFFKKRIPLCFQSITMAMGCRALSSLFNICYALTNGVPAEGFTPAYMGHIGFFLFFITASYGQMDKIIDDGTKAFRPSRIIALVAPAAALVLLVPNLVFAELSALLKATYVVIWAVGSVSVYFNLKHAIVPDLDFGFVRALKPYNALSLVVGFAEFLCLTSGNFDSLVLAMISSLFFSVSAIFLIHVGRKGAKKWTI